MYIVPQVLVHQELEVVPATNVTPLYACIVGPNYDLIRYDEAAEKTKGSLGAYVSASDIDYLWPNRPAGGIVDQNWTKVFADEAYLKYWSNPSTINVPASGDSNRVTSPSINFVSYGAWARDASLNERDVKVGDGVRVTGGGEDILTRVTGFKHEEVSSSVGSATADSDNQGAETAAVSSSQTAGDENEVIISAEDGSSYDGLEDAVLSETYTVEVVTGGAPSSARLKVISASGKDNQSSITPEAFASPTAIGTRGLTVTFNNTGTGTDTPLDEFIVGQTWEVTVAQDYTAPTPAEGGTYTGPSDTSYIITVSKGGDLNEAVVADKPTITVTSNTGIDFSGPHPIDNSSAVTIGNYGVTIAFTGNALITGDRFIIPATAAKDGAIRTLVLANALPSSLQGTSVSIDLYIIKDAEIPEFVIGGVGAKNFEQSATELTVKSDIQLTDSTWYNSVTGEEILMDLYQGNLYVQYRSLLQTYADHTRIFTLDDLSAQITPDNPFMYGLFKALSNSGGTPVRGIAVATNDLAGYTKALDDLTARNDVFGIVPLTQDKAIQNAVAASVEEMSSPENGRWRVAWLNSAAVIEEGVYTEDEAGDDLMVTVVDDDTTSGTQYTKLMITDGELITKGVISGDILRVNYGINSQGETIYEEYAIDRIISEDVAILVTGPSVAINVASKAEIWRNLDKDEIAQKYAQESGAFGSRRVRHIWPDVLTADGQEVKGFYLCAALSGLRAGSAPHQGLTNVEIAGFEAVDRTTEFFSKPQLDTMAEAGTWIVTQDFETGTIYSRHQLTTGDYNDQNQREDSITTNLDSISYYVLRQFEPYIGKSNVTPEFLGLLEVILDKALGSFTRSFTATLGPQIISFDVIEVRQHEVLRDRVVVTVNLVLPFPFNNLELHLVV